LAELTSCAAQGSATAIDSSAAYESWPTIYSSKAFIASTNAASSRKTATT